MASTAQGVVIGLVAALAGGYCIYLSIREGRGEVSRPVSVLVRDAAVPGSPGSAGGAAWDDNDGPPDALVRITCDNPWGRRTLQTSVVKDSFQPRFDAEAVAQGEDSQSPRSTVLWITPESTVMVELLDDDSAVGDGSDPSRLPVMATWSGPGRDFLSAGRIEFVGASPTKDGKVPSVAYEVQDTSVGH